MDTKELRKMLNKAWDEGRLWRARQEPKYGPQYYLMPNPKKARYRGVSKILKEAKQRKDGP